MPQLALSSPPEQKPARGATITREFPVSTGRKGGPSLCSVLHRPGFFLRPALQPNRWALTPPFHPYPALFPAPDLKLNSPSENGAGRYIFCDTFRRLGLALLVARAFARRAAYRCSDFPLPQIALRAAIACHNEIIYGTARCCNRRATWPGDQTRRSILRAKVKSMSVNPPAECVARVSFTLFHRISISGW